MTGRSPQFSYTSYRGNWIGNLAVIDRREHRDDNRCMHSSSRILLCVTGLSPQVVTETCFALVKRTPVPWIPTEIHVITTKTGADNARLNLLSDAKGWFHRLCADYQLPPIRFDTQNILVIKDRAGMVLSDIRSQSDNEDAADFICQMVRDLTVDNNSELHVSIAGGRKTMGYYLGYALSLFGREQDRLSHVLVSAPFENSPQFYYPTPYEMPIDTRQGEKTLTLDARDAIVELADIPFVRLRHGQPVEILEGRAQFSQSVRAVQRAFAPPNLIVDLAHRRIQAGDDVISLPPTQIAFLAWFARRKLTGLPPLLLDKRESERYAQSFLSEYAATHGALDNDEATARRLADGMDGAMFSETKSKLHRNLNAKLGRAAAMNYQIKDTGSRGNKCFFLDLDAARIHFRSVELNAATASDRSNALADQPAGNLAVAKSIETP